MQCNVTKEKQKRRLLTAVISLQKLLTHSFIISLLLITVTGHQIPIGPRNKKAAAARTIRYDTMSTTAASYLTGSGGGGDTGAVVAATVGGVVVDYYDTAIRFL
jgi:hypothetical protein